MSKIRNRAAEMGGYAFLLEGGHLDGASAQAEAYRVGPQAPGGRA